MVSRNIYSRTPEVRHLANRPVLVYDMGMRVVEAGRDCVSSALIAGYERSRWMTVRWSLSVGVGVLELSHLKGKSSPVEW